MPASPIGDAELKTTLQHLPTWAVDDRSLTRTFQFLDFARAWGFLSMVALYAEKTNHHPEWTNIYNRVSIRISTHDAGGITALDLHFAEHCDRLFSASL